MKKKRLTKRTICLPVPEQQSGQRDDNDFTNSPNFKSIRVKQNKTKITIPRNNFQRTQNNGGFLIKKSQASFGPLRVLSTVKTLTQEKKIVEVYIGFKFEDFEKGFQCGILEFENWIRF